MPTIAEQKLFYDGFLKQLATENSRHKRIYQSLDMLPLGKVLDLGCGAGLTSKYLADGGRDVLAVDFAPGVIAYSEKHNSNDRIKYVCADITEFETTEKFDAICLIDVYEHLTNPWAVADLIGKASHDQTIIYLNIPYSETLAYLHNNHPQILQPVDNPSRIEEVLALFAGIGFVPFKMELYWVQYIEYFFCSRKQFNFFMNKAYPCVLS